MVIRTRCKSALFLCVFIVCVHLFLMLSLRGEGVAMRDVDRELARLHGRVLVRRDGAAPHRALQEERGTLEENVILGPDDVGAFREDDGGKDFDPDTDEYENCRAGHVTGLKPQCDRGGCLERLEPSEVKVNGQGQDKFGDIPKEAEEIIAYFRGAVYDVHVTLVSLLSKLQWRYKTYGTVGETGVYEGKFAAILSYNTNYPAGEILYVVDYFAAEEIDEHFDTFARNMARIGLVDVMGDPSSSAERKIMIHRGDILDTERTFLREMGLHQFRLFSIGANLDGVSISSGLTLAACVLVDGGIIVVDGLTDPSSPAKNILRTFFKENGRGALSPLLAIRNKLYICTTNWKDKYERHLLLHWQNFEGITMREVTNTELGEEFTYLTAFDG